MAERFDVGEGFAFVSRPPCTCRAMPKALRLQTLTWQGDEVTEVWAQGFEDKGQKKQPKVEVKKKPAAMELMPMAPTEPKAPKAMKAMKATKAMKAMKAKTAKK